MVFGEFVLFLCLFLAFIYFVTHRRRYKRVKVGYLFISIGLALVSLTSFIDFLIVGPNHFLPYVINDAEIIEIWRIYGYLPGLICILIGMSGFMPAISHLNDEIETREMSEKKHRQQALALQVEKSRAEKAERVLVEALESISDAFIIFDVEDRVVGFNSKYVELFSSVSDILKPGVTFEELIRHQASTLDLFDSPQLMEEWVLERLEEHRNPSEPKEQIFEGGQIYRLSEFQTVSGGTVALRTDITELRERENALRHLNERFEEAQSVAHIGNWIRDMENTFCEWSPEISRIVGYEHEKVNLARETFLTRVHPDDLERMVSVVDWATENGEDYQVEYRVVRPDEEVLHVRELGGVLKDNSGRTILARGTLQDITTQHLVEQELIEAKMKAEEGIKAKSMFLANMSHELRTPLNAVIGFAEVISKEIFGPVNHDKYKEYSENILSSGQHLLSLINDILDFSRMEAGKYELHETSCNLNDILSWTGLMLESNAKAKAISLSIEPSTIELFNGDERKLKQVMVNLVNNALKFTPTGGKVSVSVQAETENYVSLFVEDNGHGISPLELDKVMRPFGRTKHSISRSIEGTGLGLPLSKSIVEMHDGELRISSIEAEGTIVEIRLPRKRFEELATVN